MASKTYALMLDRLLYTDGRPSRNHFLLEFHCMKLVWNSLLYLAIFGVLTSTGYLILLLGATARFRRRKRADVAADQPLPPSTMMKPLCGMEPRLEENLESFFLQ